HGRNGDLHRSLSTPVCRPRCPSPHRTGYVVVKRPKRMNIRLLGTGGADGVPALYSDSRVSLYAREHGGKDIRSRAAALIDGVLKIDLGPDTWSQLTREGLDARDWTALLFTRSDADHFAPDE